VGVPKWQKIMISWQHAVWLIEALARRPLATHLSYSDMKSTGRQPVLARLRTTAVHEGPVLGRGVWAGCLEPWPAMSIHLLVEAER
jgi:hypothetical protein